jgi:hypothetical protein
MARAQEAVGLNRIEASVWVSRRSGYTVPHTSLRNWERCGLLRHQHPGRRAPCAYGVPDLIAAATIGALRRDGASLQRVRHALRELRHLLPDILDKPGTWHLAVDGRGHVVHVEGTETLLELSSRPRQIQSQTLTLFDAGAIAREARAEMERRGLANERRSAWRRARRRAIAPARKRAAPRATASLTA